MRKTLLLILVLSQTALLVGQNMTLTKLDSIINSAAQKVEKDHSRWSFLIHEIPFMVIADSTHNRMRIISPITEVSRLDEDLKTAALMANFHTALDIKYAITNEILWSVFIHPLKELSEAQVYDALGQVYFGNITFGTTFSSSSLIFPGRKPEEPKAPEKEEIKKKQQLMEKI